MSAQRFSSGKRFHWQDATYEIRRLLPEGKIDIENVFTGDVTVVELLALIEALFDGKLRFFIEGKLARPSPDGESSTQSRFADLASCPEHLLAIARRRLDVIQPLLAMKSQEPLDWPSKHASERFS